MFFCRWLQLEYIYRETLRESRKSKQFDKSWKLFNHPKKGSVTIFNARHLSVPCSITMSEPVNFVPGNNENGIIQLLIVNCHDDFLRIITMRIFYTTLRKSYLQCTIFHRNSLPPSVICNLYVVCLCSRLSQSLAPFESLLQHCYPLCEINLNSLFLSNVWRGFYINTRSWNSLKKIDSSIWRRADVWCSISVERTQQ